MSFHTSQPLKEIIRYQDQLNSTIQQIQNLILDPKPQHQHPLANLISEQNQLIKIIEVQSARLSPESKQIYNRNLIRFRKKIKQHRQYMYSEFGRNALPNNNVGFSEVMRYQKQNMQLANDKMIMYQNQRTQNLMGQQLTYQGQRLNNGINRNRDIRQQANSAQSTINLIQLSILKRKFMFGSLVALFILALIIVIIVKANKKS